MRQMRKALLTVWSAGILCLAACSNPERARFQRDVEQAREAIRAEMRDPESASFRNERIRVLWTKQGSRVRVYCADVNGGNAFGGKTGFQPVKHYLEVKIPGGPVKNLIAPGFTIFPKIEEEDYYVECDRPDTERTEETIGSPLFDIAPLTQQSMDEANTFVPVISDQLAPELR